MGFDDPNASALTTARLGSDDYLDILTQCGQQSHQPAARKIGEAAIEQGRNFRLIDAHQAGRSHLGQTALLDDVLDAASELSLCEFFFRLRETQIGEYVPGARRH